MGPDVVRRPAGRCPHCGAGAPAGAPWCSLCHADLRLAPQPPAAPAAPPAPPAAAAAGSAPAAAGAPAAPGWPCSRCGSRTPLDAARCDGCGAPFLAGLRDAEPPLLVLPGVGDVARLGPAQRLVLAAALVLAAVGATAAAGVLAG